MRSDHEVIVLARWGNSFRCAVLSVIDGYERDTCEDAAHPEEVEGRFEEVQKLKGCPHDGRGEKLAS